MDGRSGMCHAGVGTTEDWLVRYFGDHLRSERRHGRHSSEGRVWFEPEAVYRGILFGSAFVMLMLDRLRALTRGPADQRRPVRPASTYLCSQEHRRHAEARPDHALNKQLPVDVGACLIGGVAPKNTHAYTSDPNTADEHSLALPAATGPSRGTPASAVPEVVERVQLGQTCHCRPGSRCPELRPRPAPSRSTTPRRHAPAVW
jgi:hypothetical protein